jgi:hypothetical protein
MQGPCAKTAEETGGAFPLTDRAPPSRLAGGMIQPSEISDGVAPPNQRYRRPPDSVPGLALRWLLRLAGQVRRQYLCRFRPDYVARAKAARRGQCRQCGACCDLTFHCPFLTSEYRCNRYDRRTQTCREFPIDARDLRLTRVPCGHYYDSPPPSTGPYGEDNARADSSG